MVSLYRTLLPSNFSSLTILHQFHAIELKDAIWLVFSRAVSRLVTFGMALAYPR